MKPASLACVSACGDFEHAIPDALLRLRELAVGSGIDLPPGPVVVLLHELPHELPSAMRQLDVGLALSQSWPRNEEMSVRRFGGGDHLVIRHQGTYRDLVVMLARVHAACDLDMDLRHDGRRPSVILFREEPPGTPGEPFEAEIGLPVCAQLPERPMRHAQDGLSV